MEDGGTGLFREPIARARIQMESECSSYCLWFLSGGEAASPPTESQSGRVCLLASSVCFQEISGPSTSLMASASRQASVTAGQCNSVLEERVPR